jgi:hypothetical protein
LAPQPIIRIVNGLQCKHCPIEPSRPHFRTQSQDAMKKYGNKAHDKKRVKDEDLFDSVKFQSWFWEGKERYWVVDEN